MSDQCGDFAEAKAEEFINERFQKAIGFRLEDHTRERLRNSLRSLIAYAWEKGADAAHERYYDNKWGL